MIITAVAFLLLIGLVTGLIIERQRRRYAELAEAKNRNDVARAMRLAVAGELSGSIAHEIAQPLSAILNNVVVADLVLESGADKRDELRAILSDIRRDNQRATEVIRRLRALFAKHENERRPFKLDDAMSDVASLLTAEAERREITLEVLPGPGNIIVSGDRIEIGQVLINLASSTPWMPWPRSPGTGVRSRCLSIGLGTKLSSRFAIAVMALLLSNFRSYFVLSSHRDPEALGWGCQLCAPLLKHTVDESGLRKD